MTRFNANASRRDPYKGFNFRVSFDGRYVAGVTNVSGLSRKSHSADHREGADPGSTQTAAQRNFDAVTLERGVTHDAEFEAWASNALAGQGSLDDNRKDIIIELLDETGEPVCAYKIFQCWVSRLHTIPDRDANENGLAIESLTLDCEGWEQTFDPSTAAQSQGNAETTTPSDQGET